MKDTMLKIWDCIFYGICIVLTLPACFMLWFVTPYTTKSWSDYYEVNAKRLMWMFHVARIYNNGRESYECTLERCNDVLNHDIRPNYFRKCYGRDHKWIFAATEWCRKESGLC